MKFILFLILLGFNNWAFGQTNASPANWLYPDGNLEATKYVTKRSSEQGIDSFGIKWSSSAISGDVKPLIGNIIVNNKLFDSYQYAPNEITAVVGDKIVIIDGTGKEFFTKKIPDFINGVSVLMDTTRTTFPTTVQTPVVMGLETIETSRAKLDVLPDTLALAYLAGFNHIKNEPQILKRMAIDMRDVAPNFSASIKPFFGMSINNKTKIYAQVNSSNPTFDKNDINPTKPPFYRGIFQFDAGIELSNFPLTDIGYDTNNIIYIAPEVGFAQPSMSNFDGIINVQIPNQPVDDYSIQYNFNIASIPTISDQPYIFDLVFDGELMGTINIGRSLSIDVNGTRPKMRTNYVQLWDPDRGQERTFLLVSENYSGVDNSVGNAIIHLFDQYADPVAVPNLPNNPPIKGGLNQNWTISVGNLDGDNNQKLPYYPNNPGREIIATQSSRDFAYPGSRIFVLKYNGEFTKIPKTSPPNEKLNPFDTICSQKINGWIAAINDLDGAANRKDEILIVNGSKIMVLQMRDYDTEDFQLGNRFDTLYTRNFEGETISFASIADIEGDGKNDIIVTTYSKTYIIGSALENVLDVYDPITSSAPLCTGDSVEIRWRNLVPSGDDVNIVFVPIDEFGIPLGTVDTIATNLNNSLDSLEYTYYVDSLVTGKTGFFIVHSVINPTKVFDITATFSFNLPNISQFYKVNPTEVFVGDRVEFIGELFCNDSLSLQYSTPSTTFWEVLNTIDLLSSPTFTIDGEVPCLNYFICDGADTDSLIYFRLVSYKEKLVNYSQTFTSLVRPLRIDFTVDSSGTADPTKIIKWNQMDSELTCDSVYLSYSVDNGNSFIFLDEVSFADEEYIWSIPLNLPNEIQIKMCCEQACFRSSNTFTGFEIKNIQIVAPNPFRPPFEELEIVYFLRNDAFVTISVVDQNNRIVAIPIENQFRNAMAAYTDKWDGRTTSGDFAANGLYYVRLEQSNGLIELYPCFLRK